MNIAKMIHEQERILQTLRILRDIEGISCKSAIDYALQQYIIQEGTAGAMAVLNASGYRTEGRLPGTQRKFVSTDITDMLDDMNAQEGIDPRIQFIASELHKKKGYRIPWLAKLVAVSDEYQKRFG